jgi:crossover junction endodeoxyribonuclease RusA
MDTFVVLGLPVPQGSMRHVGGGRIVSKSPKLKEWRTKIAQVVREQVGEPAHPDPVSVTVIFTFNKPKTVTRDLPTVPPDLDKLQRAIGDALSIDVNYLKDDAQIVEWHAQKAYGTPAGVIIQVQTL